MSLRAFVTGNAGFLGSHLTDRLLAAGHEVVGFDNFSTGQPGFVQSALEHGRFRQIRGDLLDQQTLTSAMRGCDFVFHLAANADVRFGTAHPRRDLEQNTLATQNVLEAMRACGIRRIAFTSTGSVYGEARVLPTPEDAPFPVQTSLYGASKLAGEGLIAAYAEGFGFQSWIFRCVSILGERYSHGHVYDFCRQLAEHPDRLQVLGDGRQRKSYLYVQDCVEAMLLAVTAADGPVNILNVGTDTYCELSDSIGWICAALELSPRITYGGGDRGWTGDNPFIWLDTRRLQALGWRPTLTIEQAVRKTAAYLAAHRWLLDARPDQSSATPHGSRASLS